MDGTGRRSGGRSVMIQGTMSGVGKSMITAGLCRIFMQDGYRAAPFKSQNMALNSYVTTEGLEIGRAQAMQAQAAGIEPSVRMNPILLKPMSDIGSQVIVNGEPIGDMNAQAYYAYKERLRPLVREAYRSLAEENDIVVIEGAGSPAEINLKDNDIVNMGMAEMADAPVLLVGDIDRGGVFAQLYGTLALLTGEERRRVRGVLINKFRGDITLLQPGLRMLEERCETEVLGVVPYLDVDLDDEDSLSERLSETGRAEEAEIDIAVIRLPHISNYTDFNALAAVPGVNVRYVRHTAAIGTPDLLIVPGTKNTMGDLKWARESGIERALLRLHAAGTPVLGICGGYQMLGERIDDPENAEGGGSMQGMGLLPVRTVFATEKTRTRIEGELLPLSGVFAGLSGERLDGYEIHMGTTKRTGGVPFARIRNTISGEAGTDGCAADGAYGTYLHGLFDGGGTARRLAELLAAKKGVRLPAAQRDGAAASFSAYRERQYDLLAERLRASLKLQRIYEIME